ncbi:MAG: di-heme enzyme [Pseudomonadota bacterium]|nr:di-heme enzyme [Pseudomonadota bacterium]
MHTLRHRLARWASAAALGALLLACGGSDGAHIGGDGGTPLAPWRWSLPAGFAPPVVPADNPMNAAKVELGRHLFFDARLSGNGTLSCAGCHMPERAFSESRALGRGSTGQHHPRNTPSLINAAYHAALDWANPAPRTLEEQMHTPLFGTHPIEMGVNDDNRATILQRLQADAHYPARFAEAFSGEAAPIDWPKVIKAIAAFERTLVSADSRHDQAQAGQATLSAQEARGQRLFFGPKALCAQCHGGPNLGGGTFTSSAGSVGAPAFHNIGLFNIGGTGAYPAPNTGLHASTGRAEDMGKFRAPSLRNVALTAPYFHDGSVIALETVLDIHADGGRLIGPGPYAGDGRANPFKDPLIDQIDIDAQDKTDLIAFLKTLTDPGVAADPRFADPFATSR